MKDSRGTFVINIRKWVINLFDFQMWNKFQQKYVKKQLLLYLYFEYL